MDLLRSCSKQKLSFVADDPTVQATGTWYFAKDNAQAFPVPHAFGSPVWDTTHPTITDLGWDATSPRTYYNGRNLNASDGTKFAGPLQFFETGCPAPDLLPRGLNDTPVECMSPPFGIAKGGLCVPAVSAKGGLAKGGTAIIPITPGAPCVNCIGGTSLTATVVASGFVAPNAAFNGTHVLTQTISPCIWQVFLVAGLNINLTKAFPNEWRVTFNGIGFAQYQIAGVLDCLTGQTATLLASTIPSDPTCSFAFP